MRLLIASCLLFALSTAQTEFEFVTNGICLDENGDTFDALGQSVSTLEGCETLCSNELECVGISYFAEQGGCLLMFQAGFYPFNYADKGFQLSDARGTGSSKVIGDTSSQGEIIFDCYRRIFPIILHTINTRRRTEADGVVCVNNEETITTLLGDPFSGEKVTCPTFWTLRDSYGVDDCLSTMTGGFDGFRIYDFCCEMCCTDIIPGDDICLGFEPTTSSRPTTASPTESPVTSPPTDAPTASVPTPAPVTPIPTRDPSTSPESSNPTKPPVTSSPSPVPTASDPTVTPSDSPTRPGETRPPTNDPTTSMPTVEPSKAPIYWSTINDFQFMTRGNCKDADGNNFDRLTMMTSKTEVLCSVLCLSFEYCVGFAHNSLLQLCDLSFKKETYPSNYEELGYSLSDVGDGTTYEVGDTSDISPESWLCYARNTLAISTKNPSNSPTASVALNSNVDDDEDNLTLYFFVGLGVLSVIVLVAIMCYQNSTYSKNKKLETQHSHPEELPKSSPSPRRSSHSSPRRSSHSSNPPHNFNPPTPQYSVPIPPYSNSYRPSPAMNHPSPSPYHSRHAPSPYEQWRSQSMQTDLYNRRTPERTRSVQGSVASLPVTYGGGRIPSFDHRGRFPSPSVTSHYSHQPESHHLHPIHENNPTSRAGSIPY